MILFSSAHQFGEMHAGSPSSSSVAKRTRRQWEIFYRNWHNEVKKKLAGESSGNGVRDKGVIIGENTGGVGNNEGSYSVDPENDEISRENHVRRTGEGSGLEIIGKKAYEIGSVRGDTIGKKKLNGVKNEDVDDQPVVGGVKRMDEKVPSTGSCSKSGLIPNDGSVACKNCGFHNVCTVVADTVVTVNDGKNSGARRRGRPRNEPLNKGNEVPLQTSVDLGKSAEMVDSGGSEESMDSDGSHDDYSDEDYEASSEEDEDDSDEVYEADLWSSSGESDMSKHCNEETDDDTYSDNSMGGPIKTKVRPEEKEQPFVDHSLISGSSDSSSSNFNQQTEKDTFFGNDVSSAGEEEKEQSLSLSSGSSDSLISDVNYVGSAGQEEKEQTLVEHLLSCKSDSLMSGDSDSLSSDVNYMGSANREEKEQSLVDHSLSSSDSDSLRSDSESLSFDVNYVGSASQEEKEQPVGHHSLSSGDSDVAKYFDNYRGSSITTKVDQQEQQQRVVDPLSSGDFDFSKHCSGVNEEKDDDAYITIHGACPIKMKVDPEEKEQTGVSAGKNMLTNEERDSELPGLKRKYEPYSKDGSQEDGDGTDTVKLSKQDSELAGSKRKCELYPNYGYVDDSQEDGDGNAVKFSKQDHELPGTERGYKPYSNDGHLDDSKKDGDGTDTVKLTKEEKRLELENFSWRVPISKGEKSNSSLDVEYKSSAKKDSRNAKCVQRTGQKGTRKVGTFGKEKTGAPRNLDSIKATFDSIEKEVDESTPGKKKTGAERNHLNVSVDSIDKEASEPTPSEKRTNEAIKMLVDLIEKEADGPKEYFAPLNNNPNSLPLKFRFEDEEPSPPEKSEWEKELESLFCDLNMGLREIEPGCINPSTVCDNNDDESIPQVNNSTPAGLCRRGEHDPVFDEQMGIKCKYCAVVLLEIEDILPPFYTPPSGRTDRKDFGDSHNRIFDQIQFQDTDCGNPSSSSIHETGTDWNLILNTVDGMYPHQLEGFKFMWKNIARDGNGCIISHAPGTGKTRLTIVFLQAFMNKNRKCRPVIIAPRGMLLTWEDEFRKWGVNVPFHNLNKLELSEEENAFSEKLIGQVGSHWRIRDRIRFVKVISWLKSNSILGVSYPLFEKLAGEHQRKEQYDQIRELLLKKPGLLVLDEGHTPRSDQSLTWKALANVATNRRIMLSGTPFQNNFEELYNTLCLVNPLFADQIDEIHPSCKRGRKMIHRTRGKRGTLTKFLSETTNDQLMKLRTMIDPFVHVHKGTILQESLPGLRDSLVFLRPTELQNSLLQIASNGKPFLHEVCLVSLISVHPSLVADQEMFSAYKSEIERIESTIDAGVKTKFVTKLIWLADALGERVLVFSHFIDPLVFIKQQLQSQFSWNEGREVLYMDGKLEQNQRQYSINSFNDESSEAKVLLASQKACSEGINLVGASRVVLLDTAWNPSVERQAISRAYRLGQKKVVHVYRLITSGTVEVQKYAFQAHKDRISQLIFSPTDGPTCHSETSNIVSEDKVFEALVDDKSINHIFEKIIHQPKASDLIDTFDFTDLKL
ncbi:SNF2 domain-containing protein CLASSY 4-like [Olea europaea var. sylvestris]|uniref:SNF2 domain-containing protein CLASSY 4-like n=1 Tax=Olea europaea var. sylvestris TaxID=158386 RepID=UPI000C1D30F7|nr:SNF2 domain-containing protein CLASSY 4-like [Olea europaea var. sylvestris]